MDLTKLQVTSRKEVGKGSARKTRKSGFIPAVIYGIGFATKHVEVDPNALLKVLRNPKKRNTVITFVFDGGSAEQEVMLKDYQMDPIKDILLHADFIEVKKGVALNVMVPVEAIGISVGVAKGGVLTLLRREIEVQCLPTDIPDKIVLDVTNLDVGDSVHISEIKTEDKVKVIYDKNFTVLVITTPTGLEEKAAAAPAEGEEGVPAEGEAVKEGEEKKAEEKPEKEEKKEKK